MQHHVFSWR